MTHYFATSETFVNGIGNIAAKINEQLRAHGFGVRWLASEAENRVTQSRAIGDDEVGIPSWDGIREATDLAFPIFAPWRLVRIVREVRKADVVHLHEAFYPVNQAVMWSAIIFRRPIVITQHIADMPIAGAIRGNAVRLANLLMTRPAFAFAARVVYYSRRTHSHFAHLSRGKDVFIENGCDADLFLPVEREEAAALRRELELPTDGVIALFVGRFVEKKGIALIREIAAANPAVTFVFVGAGPLDPSAWQLPNVVVHSAVAQASLPRFYQASDLLVLPAVGEGLPLVVQEASCCGVPVLVSREILEACPELEPFAYDAGEAGEDLSSAFATFLSQPETRVGRVERATFARELWSWERCGEAYAEMFRSLAGRR